MSLSRKLLWLLGIFLTAACASSIQVPKALTFDVLEDSVAEWDKRSPRPDTVPVPQPKIPSDIRLAQLIEKEARRAGVDPALVAAVIQHESGGDSLAVNPNDPSYGLGQVMPRWWRYVFVEECGDEATPETLMRAQLNVCYTAHILAYANERYGGDRSSVISYYNTGTPFRGLSNGYNASIENLLASAD